MAVDALVAPKVMDLKGAKKSKVKRVRRSHVEEDSLKLFLRSKVPDGQINGIPFQADATEVHWGNIGTVKGSGFPLQHSSGPVGPAHVGHLQKGPNPDRILHFVYDWAEGTTRSEQSRHKRGITAIVHKHRPTARVEHLTVKLRRH